jgi:hypothetical protein
LFLFDVFILAWFCSAKRAQCTRTEISDTQNVLKITE